MALRVGGVFGAVILKQKTAYEIVMWLEFRRVLFRSGRDLDLGRQIGTQYPEHAYGRGDRKSVV